MSKGHQNDINEEIILPHFHVTPLRFEQVFIKNWFVLGLVVPYGLLLILGSLYALLDGTFPDLAFPWISGILTGWFVPAVLVLLGFLGITFVTWRNSIPIFFRELLRGRRFSTLDPEGDFEEEFKSFTEVYQKRLFSRWRYLISLLTALPWIPFIILTKPLAGLPTNAHPLMTVIAYLHIFILYVTLPLVWDYFLGVAIWTQIVTSITLRDLTPRFKINVLPGHPDGAGGLKSLGAFCFSMALPVLIGILVTSIYSMRAVIYYQQAPNPEAIVALMIGLSIFSLAAGIVLASVIFFWPMWDVHLDMMQQKRKYEDAFAEQLIEIETRVRMYLLEHNLEDAKKSKEERDTLEAIYPDAGNFPTWPFDTKLLLRFLTPQIIPIVGILFGTLNESTSKIFRDLLGLLGELL